MSDGVLDRAATWVLLTISRRKWGVTAVLMPEIVETLGPLGALRWMAANLPTYERGLAAMGEERGHLVCAAASMMNGCGYCMYAHGRAFELHYFARTAKLFPLDEHQLLSLMELPDASARRHLEAALTEAGLDAEAAVLRRLFALKLEGAEPAADDGHLLHAIHMFDTLNRCGILSQAAIDDAHDRISKDAALKARYAEARLREGKRPLSIEPEPE